MTSRSAQTLVAEIERSLRALGNPERAVHERSYLKSELEFVGTSVPATRRTVRAFAKERGPLDHDELVALVRALWARPVHELRASAIELLNPHAGVLDVSDLELIEALLRDAYTWAYVDALATGCVARLVEQHPEAASVLDRWAEDSDFWIRRSALLALLPALRRGEGDWERFTRYADAMLEEREFFIRKAIGWVLRETSKRRPELVHEWLEPRAGRASGVTVREAVKYLAPEQREAVLVAWRGGSAAPARGARSPARAGLADGNGETRTTP